MAVMGTATLEQVKCPITKGVLRYGDTFISVHHIRKKEFESRLGMNASLWYRMKRGEQAIKTHQIERIASFMVVSPEIMIKLGRMMRFGDPIYNAKLLDRAALLEITLNDLVDLDPEDLRSARKQVHLLKRANMAVPQNTVQQGRFQAYR
ncbi:MAG: hypothetical protein AAGF33_00390 [Pseudomonadota bacterium]